MFTKKRLVIFSLIILAIIAAIVGAYLLLNKKQNLPVGYRLYGIDGQLIPYNFEFNEPRKVNISGVLASSEVMSDDKGKYINIYLPETSYKTTPTDLKVYFKQDGVALLLVKDGKYETQQVWKAYSVDDLIQFFFEGDQVVATVEMPRADFDKLIEDYYNNSELEIYNLTNLALPS